MNPQLMLLLEIQDLHLQKAALLDEPGFDQVQEKTFNIDPKVAAEALDQKIAELQEGLEPAIKQRCERGLPTLGRMVVPVISGVCYGCFVSVPTARSAAPEQRIEICESCGRFLYVPK